ncbi:MAG: HAD-IIB family hydrolase [Bifidobacteriaceae bacterium]|nr:HAD-IIB family hydrolase [Bifidobacteriaceae bacterium]
MAELTPMAWDDVDYDALCRRIKAVAFDLDGTLARSKRPMKQPIADEFANLTHLMPVAVVSGGRWSLVDSQVVQMVQDRSDRSNLHLMPTSGTRYIRWDAAKGEWQKVFEHDLTKDERDAAFASLERRAKELGSWEEHTWGERIDDRGSQITYSALGQEAPVEAKEAWDPTGAKRKALAEACQKDLPSLTVKAGGSTSVDISLKGIDKAYAVRELCKILGIDVSQLCYIGDRMGPEGNDYPAVQAGTASIHVDGPEDTIQCIERIEASWKALHRD